MDLPVEHQLWTGSDGFQIATHLVSGMTTEPKQTTVEILSVSVQERPIYERTH